MSEMARLFVDRGMNKSNFVKQLEDESKAEEFENNQNKEPDRQSYSVSKSISVEGFEFNLQ